MGVLSSLSLLIPFSIGLLFRKTYGKLQISFLVYLLFSICIESIVWYTAHHEINNIYIFKLFLVAGAILGMVFGKWQSIYFIT